jgi:mRNA deadenylase 3'-5' endonuclease subunit Ccr4
MNERELKYFANKLSILSFNMLANSLANNFPLVESKYLTWEHRKPMILSIIQERFPDIIVLQECDKFEEISNHLKNNYDGLFAQKQGEHLDGVAIFVRKTIKIIKSYKLNFTNGSQVACIAQLAIDNKHFIVAGIHLKSSEFEEKKLLSSNDFNLYEWKFQTIRMAQIMELNKELYSYNLPFIVAGDFNEEPGKPAIQYMDSIATSAYKNQPDHYTTYKKRTDTIKCQIIDHIYASYEFKLNAILPVLKLNHLSNSNNNFLPNANYPSDHVWIYAEYFF